MGMLDLLLGAGDDLLERPEEEIEVSRLSKKLGSPFIMRIKALTLKELNEVPSGTDRAAHIVLKGVIEPDLTADALCRKYTPKERKTPLTPVEVINKLFLPGEVINVYTAITDLSGFGEDAVEKIEKN